MFNAVSSINEGCIENSLGTRMEDSSIRVYFLQFSKTELDANILVS